MSRVEFRTTIQGFEQKKIFHVSYYMDSVMGIRKTFIRDIGETSAKFKPERLKIS
jgi:hypothetical protein